MTHPAVPASSPCLITEADPANGGLPDAQTALDVARWRRAERTRLIGLRQALPVAARLAADAVLANRLDARIGPTEGRTIAITWPFKGEPDLRGWAARQRTAGARIALPVVVAKGAPLIFRLWAEGAALVRGVWDIPAPGDTAPELTPDIVIAPVVGLGTGNFRLGYGGGFYDRTLARLMAIGPKPLTLGVGYGFQAIPTIFPQPHDIAMEDGILIPLP
jgi:5,10-methenyltetrahydrofolate synthetase